MKSVIHVQKKLICSFLWRKKTGHYPGWVVFVYYRSGVGGTENRGLLDRPLSHRLLWKVFFQNYVGKATNFERCSASRIKVWGKEAEARVESQSG